MVQRAACVLALLGLALVALASHTKPYYSIYQGANNAWVIKPGKDAVNAIAWGYVVNKMNQTGWVELSVAINGAHIVDDATAMYAAGYLEGYLTQPLIWQSWPAIIFDIFGGNYTVPQGILDYTQNNYDWLVTMVKANPINPYWIHVGLILQQLSGLSDGYAAVAPADQPLGLIELSILNMNGDLEELLVSNGHIKPFKGEAMEDMMLRRLKRSHCSGLVKITPDYRELYAAHNTWESYVYLLRVFKQYDFPLVAPLTSSRRVLFSSYPGLLASVDDFYMTDQKLVVIETTNGILNASLYGLLTPKSIFSWMRAIIANRMATSGAQWTGIFAQQNSGTYNNQWFVIDYKLFTPGVPMINNTIWVLEQIPGYCHSEDVTYVLQYGYWPSYNEPYFEDIWEISGFAHNEKKNGPSQSYQLDPRGKIFRRDQGAIHDLTGMKQIMQYNNWENDPYSLGDSCQQISCRADLEKDRSQATPFGGCDTKIASHKHVTMFAAEAISGPTHQTQPPFNWNDWPGVPRLGQPDVFDFDWQTIGFSDENPPVAK